EVRKLLLKKALPFYKQFRTRRDDVRSRQDLADQNFRIGYITDEIGNKVEARRAYKQAERLYRALIKGRPTAPQYQIHLAVIRTNMGILRQAEGKREEALAAFRAARHIRQKLVKANPTVPEYQNALAGSLTNMGHLLQEEGKGREALLAFKAARHIGQKLV